MVMCTVLHRLLLSIRVTAMHKASQQVCVMLDSLSAPSKPSSGKSVQDFDKEGIITFPEARFIRLLIY